MNKTLIKTISIILIMIGGVGLYFGGGTEGFGIEIIAGTFTIIGIIMAIFKKEETK